MTNTNTQTTNLPKGWVEIPLGEVADYLNGRAFKPTEWEKEGLPIIRIQNLNDCTAEFNYTTQKFEDRYFVNNGDLLFAWSASLGSYIWNRGPAWLNQHIFKVMPKEFIEKLFLHYYLEKTILELYVKTHGSGMVHITKGKFEETPIMLPPLAEQHRIVAKIEELFSDLEHSIAALETARAQLKIYRQAVLKSAFEGKLTEKWRQQHTPSPAAELLAQIQAERTQNGKPAKPLPPLTEAELAELPGLPEGWCWVKLGELIEEPKYGTSKKCSYEFDGVPVLRIPNIGNGVVDETDLKLAPFSEEEKADYSLKSGDLLTIRSNGSVDLVGKCALVNPRDEKYLFAGYLIRLRPFKQIINPYFLLQVLFSHNLRVQIESKAKSTSGVNNINSNELKGLIVPYTNIEEQHAIIAEIEARLSVIDKLEETIETSLQGAEALRQSILKQAFAGKLVPQDPSDEPAEVLLERIKQDPKGF